MVCIITTKKKRKKKEESAHSLPFTFTESINAAQCSSSRTRCTTLAQVPPLLATPPAASNTGSSSTVVRLPCSFAPTLDEKNTCPGQTNRQRGKGLGVNECTHKMQDTSKLSTHHNPKQKFIYIYIYIMKLNTFPIKSGGIHACDTVLLKGVEISSTDRGAAMSMWYTKRMNSVRKRKKKKEGK